MEAQRATVKAHLTDSLDDYYVKYTLFVCLERQEMRLVVFDALHSNIQDRFNAYGVQIMSPHYEGDPAGKVWVPKEKWNEPPAETETKRP